MQDREYASIRCIVDDVTTAFDCSTKHLGFTESTNFAPTVADIARGSLRPRRRTCRARRSVRQPAHRTTI
jgi:hypothetical protein